MRKGIFLLATMLSFCFVSIGQTLLDKTLLWEISGKGIVSPSYLYGTLHLMCPSDLIMPEVVKQKFKTTSNLYLELDMDDPGMMREMMGGMQMKDSSTLEKLLGSSFDSVNTNFRTATGMPLKMLNRAKPLLIMSMLYPSLLGCTPVSWEGEFQKLAKEQNVEVNGLEKLQDQLDVFDKIPYKLQAEMLVKMLLHGDSSKAEFREMLQLYKNKDVNKLTEFTLKEEGFGDYQDLLLSNRNHNWIPIIGEQAKRMPTFFAFGAAHLGGEKGVIHLLRKAGFKVSPIHY